MAARPAFNTASRRPLPPEAQETAVAPGPRPEALLVVIAIALLLMVVPAVVGVHSILDATLVRGDGGWAKEVPAWLDHLSDARIVLALGLTAMVARAREDS
jgi:hypothetical protein